MSEMRMLLSKKQIETLSNHFLDELHKIPLYDTDTKKKLFSEYINRVQKMIAANIGTFINDTPDCDTKTLLAQIVADRISN